MFDASLILNSPQCRLKESLAQALAERDDDLLVSDLDNSPADKRLQLMDKMIADMFQVSLIEHLTWAYGDEVLGKIKAKCALDSNGLPPTDAVSCR